MCDPVAAKIEGAHIDITLGGDGYWLFTASALRYPLRLKTADPYAWFRRCVPSNGIISIPAGCCILAHTHEYIGTAPGSGLRPMLDTRSTAARWFVSIHQAAGVGDEGYVSRWTLEIHNPLPVAMELDAGMRLGSIAFDRIEGAATPYQPGTRYNAPRGEWTVESMLPRKGNW